ncbi:MAG: hypothetical protein OEW08_10945 [Gammaproteobacteria bacterium]|nr:hypothetical protein [Gammaproteobacteria bacterium]
MGCKPGSANSTETDNPYTPLEFTTLASGTDPLSGFQGEKKIAVVRSEPDFATLWSQYSSESLPKIDFSKNTVIVLDSGIMDMNLCNNVAHGESVEVTRHASANFVQVNRHYRQSCPNTERICMAVILSGRPFEIVSVPVAGGQIFVGETVTVENCS